MAELNASYRICWTIDQWVSALREASEAAYLGFDFETCPDRRKVGAVPVKQALGINPLRPEDGSRICGIAIAWGDDPEDEDSIRSAYVPIRHDPRFVGGRQPPSRGVLRAFADFMRARGKRFTRALSQGAMKFLNVVHNLSMELSFMLADKIPWPEEGQLHDIQVAARVLNKGVGWQELIGLKPLQKEVLGRNLDSKDDMDRWLKARKFKPGKDIWRAPAAIAGWYAQDDARDTLLIFFRWMKHLVQPPTKWWWHRAPDRRYRLDLYELEIRTAINATISCLRGTRVDLGLARKQAKASELLQDVTRRWIQHKMNVPTLNPGSQTQLRGLLFSDLYGVQISMENMTDAFKKLPEREQSKTVAGVGEKKLKDYASLDIAALKHYEGAHPEHADLMFMLAVYRKCDTAKAWFGKRVLEFGLTAGPDPWWELGTGDVRWLNMMFHRLRTVGTTSGRMSSSDYNGQQVPKRFKMLLDAARLIRILAEFLPESQLRELFDMLVMDEAQAGDEAKVVGVQAGAPVVDFSVRNMFIPRPGMNMRLWDLSQVELRGFAHFTGNQLMCGGYGAPMSDEYLTQNLGFIQALMDRNEPAFMEMAREFGIDVDYHFDLESRPFDAHQFVADELGIPRKGAKGINFGIIYGMGKKKLARSLGWSVMEGKAYLAAYNQKFPEIAQIQLKIKQTLRKRGYIFDPFGRRYFLPMSKSYVGLNRLIQGWAATTFKVGFVRMCEMSESPGFGAGSVDPLLRVRTRDGMRVLTCIHDENMAEVHKELDGPMVDWAVRMAMVGIYGLRVPLGTSSERSPVSWDKAVEVHKAA